VSLLLRCITVDKETIIATNDKREILKRLSDENNLLCPNCLSKVIFKSGRVKRPHFAHYDSECVVSNYEPETPSHIKGKQILFDWLSKKYPSAVIQYEVYIAETRQIADVYVEHKEKDMIGIRWAFEFQHSPLSSTEWESRHELYRTAGIQDFWILDKAKFMKFSKAQDIENARIRNELEQTIFAQTGLCYFLDIETSDLTIDFKFISSYHSRMVNGVERNNEYTYHDPIQHSMSLEQIRVRMNDRFKYGVLIFPQIEELMKESLIYILHKLEAEQARKAEQILQEKANEKRSFAQVNYGDQKAEMYWKFMKANKSKITEDVIQLSAEDFIDKYDSFFVYLQLNIKEFEKLKEEKGLVERLLVDLSYEYNFYKLEFLNNQGEDSLTDYLKKLLHEDMDIVSYVYDEYREVLDGLASMRFKAIKGDLKKINSHLIPYNYEENPSAIDYALRFHLLKSREEVDRNIKQIRDQITECDPFAELVKEMEEE